MLNKIIGKRVEMLRLRDRVEVSAIEKAYVRMYNLPEPPFPVIIIQLHIRNGTDRSLSINKIEMVLNVNDRFLANINESNIGTIEPYDLDFLKNIKITTLNQAIPDFKEYNLWIEAIGEIELQSGKVKIQKKIKNINGMMRIEREEWLRIDDAKKEKI